MGKESECLVAVDLEMTGLRADQDHILEIGCVKIENGQLTERFQTLVNPGVPIPEVVRELTGITREMLKGAPEEEQALRQFLEFAGDAPLLGHNLMCDYRFLKQCAVNARIPLERCGIDTLKISRKLLEKPERKSLDALCEYFSIERMHRHRALEDAIATGKLYLLLKEKFFQEQKTLFQPEKLNYRGKKKEPMTPAQKRDLNHFLIYHKIERGIDFLSLTRSEASRLLNELTIQYGNIRKQEESQDV